MLYWVWKGIGSPGIRIQGHRMDSFEVQIYPLGYVAIQLTQICFLIQNEMGQIDS